MTVSQLERTLSAAELAEWEAFNEIEPIGDDRADLRTGILASLWANMHRRKGSPAFKPTDFMPFVDREAVKRRENSALSEKIRGALMGMGGGRSRSANPPTR